MADIARRIFISGISALQSSLGSALVSGSDTVGSFLRRGLQIVGYGLLETFIVDRLGELTNHMNSGLSHVSDLPEKLQRAAFQEILRIAADKVQWIGSDLPSILSFTSDLGGSLAAASGPIRLSPLTWQWRGSNMSPDDLHRALRLFHVMSPWQTMADICQRAGFQISDPKTAAISLLRERNSSAHDSTYQVSNLIARAAPQQLLALGFCADVVMSVAAHHIQRADQNYLRDVDWIRPDRIKFRFVRARAKDWAEIPESSLRASRVSADRDTAFKRACVMATGKSEVVVLQDQARQILDWSYPAAP